jgi:hypothetical protein
MTVIRHLIFVAALAAFAILDTQTALALPIKEFKRFSAPDQATYLIGAVSMLAYSYAANGDTAKARCVQNWYFGEKGQDTPGPRQLSVEIVAAESVDAAKYHVEGVILGLTDKVCGATIKQKP